MPEKPRSILIVTGAHLTAEIADRPLAYRLREQMLARLEDAAGEHLASDSLIVCSDLWYLNKDELRDLPAISIGGPTVNALTASWADRLPSLFAIDNVLIVQGEWTAPTPVAALWGVNGSATARAVETFREKYLDEFLAAAE